jgi:hypothetical protein
LPGNPANPVEAKFLELQKAAGPTEESRIPTYNLKVGDICLTVIGLIVGRGYQAIVPDSTFRVYIASPSNNAAMRDRLLRLWLSDDPVKHVFNSLLLDYSTRGSDKDRENCWRACRFQTSAIRRLPYYFPKETAPLIARRLQALRVDGPGYEHPWLGMDRKLAWERREMENGGDTEGLIRAANWCEIPAVRKAIQDICERTEDPELFLAALTKEADAKQVFRRISSFIEKLPRDEGENDRRATQLLRVACGRLHSSAKPIFERYLKGAGPIRCYKACYALRDTESLEWSIELLAPLLDDKRQVPDQRFRVCDWAAMTLSSIRPELKFTTSDTQAELDKQIQAIRQQLAKGRNEK